MKLYVVVTTINDGESDNIADVILVTDDEKKAEEMEASLESHSPVPGLDYSMLVPLSNPYGGDNMDKTYHYVQVIEDGDNLMSSDLFINDLEGAKKLFVEKIKEEDPTVTADTIEIALDNGYRTMGTTVVMYVEPHSIIGKE